MVGPPDQPPLLAGTPGALLAALGDGRLAIGQTETVPAGIYGRAWMENAGLWPKLAPRLAEAENVRAALAFVARGEAPLGLVYASDATAEPRVKVVYRVPPELHPQIIYPAAYLTPAGARFLAFLSTPEATQVFKANGFRPLDAQP